MWQVLHIPHSESSDSLNSVFGDDKETVFCPSTAGPRCFKEVARWGFHLCISCFIVFVSSTGLIWNFLFDFNYCFSCFWQVSGLYKFLWFSLIFNPLQEPDVLNEVSDEKRASLLMMNFSVNEINSAMDRLGMWNFLII